MRNYLVLTIIALMSILSSEVVLAGQYLPIKPYESKNFPPEEIITKSFNAAHRVSKLVKIVGKYQSDNNRFYVYYFASDSNNKALFSSIPMILTRLDSNIWILEMGRVVYVLEKI